MAAANLYRRQAPPMHPPRPEKQPAKLESATNHHNLLSSIIVSFTCLLSIPPCGSLSIDRFRAEYNIQYGVPLVGRALAPPGFIVARLLRPRYTANRTCLEHLSHDIHLESFLRGATTTSSLGSTFDVRRTDDEYPFADRTICRSCTDRPGSR